MSFGDDTLDPSNTGLIKKENAEKASGFYRSAENLAKDLETAQRLVGKLAATKLSLTFDSEHEFSGVTLNLFSNMLSGDKGEQDMVQMFFNTYIEMLYQRYSWISEQIVEMGFENPTPLPTRKNR